MMPHVEKSPDRWFKPLWGSSYVLPKEFFLQQCVLPRAKASVLLENNCKLLL